MRCDTMQRIEDGYIFTMGFVVIEHVRTVHVAQHRVQHNVVMMRHALRTRPFCHNHTHRG